METTLDNAAHAPSSPPPPGARPAPIAPWWHTAALLALVAAMTVGGALYQNAARAHTAANPAAASAHPQVVPLYLSLLLLEWGLFRYVTKAGLAGKGSRFAELVGRRWQGPRDVLRDLGLAVLVWAAWTGGELAWSRLLPHDAAASIGNLLPRGALEKTLWIALSISAGICEEVAFRGYLQRQFAAWTGNRWVAWALQAIAFGLGHGYQGVRACAVIALYGALFGLLARWRGSLLPGILAHALTDLLSGLFGV